MEKSNMKIKLIPKYTQWQGPVNLLDYVVNLSRETLIVSFYNLNYPFPKEFRYWKKPTISCIRKLFAYKE